MRLDIGNMKVEIIEIGLPLSMTANTTAVGGCCTRSQRCPNE